MEIKIEINNNLNKNSNLIHRIIQILHIIFVISIILSIFIPNNQFKSISFVLLLFLFAQYITNYGRCGLTELEYLFKGEKYEEGFLYRLIKPIISIPEKYFDTNLYILHIVWTLILAIQLKYINLSNLI